MANSKVKQLTEPNCAAACCFPGSDLSAGIRAIAVGGEAGCVGSSCSHKSQSDFDCGSIDRPDVVLRGMVSCGLDVGLAANLLHQYYQTKLQVSVPPSLGSDHVFESGSQSTAQSSRAIKYNIWRQNAMVMPEEPGCCYLNVVPFARRKHIKADLGCNPQIQKFISVLGPDDLDYDVIYRVNVYRLHSVPGTTAIKYHIAYACDDAVLVGSFASFLAALLRQYPWLNDSDFGIDDFSLSSLPLVGSVGTLPQKRSAGGESDDISDHLMGDRKRHHQSTAGVPRVLQSVELSRPRPVVVVDEVLTQEEAAACVQYAPELEILFRNTIFRDHGLFAAMRTLDQRLMLLRTPTDLSPITGVRHEDRSFISDPHDQVLDKWCDELIALASTVCVGFMPPVVRSHAAGFRVRDGDVEIVVNMSRVPAGASINLAAPARGASLWSYPSETVIVTPGQSDDVQFSSSITRPSQFVRQSGYFCRDIRLMAACSMVQTEIHIDAGDYNHDYVKVALAVSCTQFKTAGDAFFNPAHDRVSCETDPLPNILSCLLRARTTQDFLSMRDADQWL